MLSQMKFPHRHNSDGGYDSICTACFVTVASVRDEELLRADELAHVCDPVNLYRISQACPSLLLLLPFQETSALLEEESREAKFFRG